jgi:hypothetical protein
MLEVEDVEDVACTGDDMMEEVRERNEDSGPKSMEAQAVEDSHACHLKYVGQIFGPGLTSPVAVCPDSTRSAENTYSKLHVQNHVLFRLI